MFLIVGNAKVYKAPRYSGHPAERFLADKRLVEDDLAEFGTPCAAA
jgi:hypothetical protein